MIFLLSYNRKYTEKLIDQQRMEIRMTKAVWMLHAKKADFNALSGRFHISPVTARIIRNRDIESEAEFERYLNGSLEDLY